MSTSRQDTLYITTLPVDAGVMSIADVAHLDEPERLASARFDQRTYPTASLGDHAAECSSGFGDGGYGLYVSLTPDGSAMLSCTVEFIDLEESQEDDFDEEWTKSLSTARWRSLGRIKVPSGRVLVADWCYEDKPQLAPFPAVSGNLSATLLLPAPGFLDVSVLEAEIDMWGTRVAQLRAVFAS